jgi:E3 ubiquitin-protein ligase DOA10
MFKHIVTQVSGRLTALSTQALALLKELLLRLVSYLLASCILVFLSVASLYNRLVKILSKIKVLLASLTTQVLSIKQGLKLVATTSGQNGQLLVTTVRQTLQRVKALFKKGK